MTSRLAELRGRVAAVRDENAGNRLHAQRQQPGDRRRRPQASTVDTLASASSMQTGERRDQDQQLLRMLRADQTISSRLAVERTDDGAERVRGIDAADQPRRIVVGRGHRRQRQRKARAPQHRARQHREQAAHEIELELEPRRSAQSTD